MPIADVRSNRAHLALLEQWMKSYRPRELFDESGAPLAELRRFAPKGARRMGMSPHSNGGAIKRALRLPDFRGYAQAIEAPGTQRAENTRPLGALLRDVMHANPRNFRVFGPDETTSNKLGALYEASKKLWLAARLPEDEQGGELASDGRVVEMLSEHTMEGMLEGYLLSGRHGLISSYEAFVHVIDSMFNHTPSGWTRPTTSRGAPRWPRSTS